MFRVFLYRDTCTMDFKFSQHNTKQHNTTQHNKHNTTQHNTTQLCVLNQVRSWHTLFYNGMEEEIISKVVLVVKR